MLYVTHDREEALVMSDRIAIFSMGRIEQLGSGEDLYDRPRRSSWPTSSASRTSCAARPSRRGAGGWMTHEGARWRVGGAAAAGSDIAGGATAALVVRPERMRIPTASAGQDVNTLDVTVDEVLYLGPDTKYQLALPSGQRIAIREPREANARELQRGDRVRVGWSVDDGLLVGIRAALDPGVLRRLSCCQ